MLGVVGFLLSLFAVSHPLWASEVSSERQSQLMHMLKHDCGSCHGLTLQGGLGPPLTRDALKDRPPITLRQTILHGRPGTPMPPFAGLLSEPDVDWLVTSLREGRGE